MTSKCIYTLARSRPLSASPNSLDRGLQVYLQNHSITASKVHLQSRSVTASNCISKLTRLRPPSVTPNSLNHGLQRASPMSLDHSLQLHLQTRSIAASKCVSKLARSQPRSVSLCSLDRHFQAHLELLSSTACSQSKYTMCRWVAIWIHRYIEGNTN
jgi:hypothetical protein